MDRDERAILLCGAIAVFSIVAGTTLAVAGLPQPVVSVDNWPQLIGQSVGCLIATIVTCSIFPWALSRVAAEWIVATTWPIISAALLVARPLLAFASATDMVFHRLAGRDDPEKEQDTISEEIDAVVDEGERDGSIEEGVSQMIQRVVDLQNVDVRDVMTPRTEIVTLAIEADIDEAKRCFVNAGHSRIPVIGESPDDLLGVVYAKDLLHVGDDAGELPDLKALLREPLIVPETTAVDQLLERMRQFRMHIAMVLDEYGGVVGLVTLEDILEEIVGDISDEYDPETEDDEIVQIDNRTIEVDARVHVDDLNEQFDYELPDDGDFETIGGFVFSEMGHVPERGESVVWKNLEITVVDADKRKVVRLKVQQMDAAQVASTG